VMCSWQAVTRGSRGADVARGGGASVEITAWAQGVRMWPDLSLLVED